MGGCDMGFDKCEKFFHPFRIDGGRIAMLIEGIA